MLPVLTCQRYNFLLKEIGAAAKIKVPVTTHMARRTFASSIAYAYGASIQTVGTVLGHHKLRSTVQYARVTNEKIKKEMKGMKKD
jgi:site-specific recombinase XerD